MKYKFLLLLVIIFICCGNALAITTDPATLVGSNNVTLNGRCIHLIDSEQVWFEWGQNNASYSWRTPNITSTDWGFVPYSYRIHGSPLNGNVLYWYRMCHSITGCGSNVSFVTASVTPMPTTTLGYIFENLTETQFDIMFIPKNLIAPYSDWIEPTGQENSGLILSIVFGMIFFAIFAGMWMSGRSTFIPGMVGLIASGLLWGTGGAGGLGILIAPEFVAVAQGIMVASFAGVIMGMIKR
jgi:hypothetical protein